MLQNKVLAVAAGAFALFTSNAWAQESGIAASSASRTIQGYAAASFQAPVGFGMSWGAIGAGAYAQTLGSSSDGAAGISFGLGDADKYVGLETSAVFSSLTGHGSSDSFGDSGSFGLKLHTNLPGDAAFGVGVIGTGEWGSQGFKDANSSSVYAAVTKGVQVGNHVAILNLGVGDNLFNEPGKTSIGVFGSGAFYFTNWLSVIGEYSGRFTNAAISIAPLPQFLPLTITVGAINLGKRYGGDVELGGTVGLGYNFK
ncbi:MAG: hypothetical protein JWQ90_123 [Hydrocarboniphaga sp.]|uniref:hypothetical protein n=1 Tax=Hydrocarboniphaga sp. TaxID=2033016 RepID=UPI00262F2347|nr:hypothetical protein [Hydrocarboniphaga sp.]MDB5967673.1 hypothetical protein [Hydrocarboniphaga sp.]